MEVIEREELMASSSCESSCGVVLLCICRICHEEEEERETRMESPCACSGTLKFAHRGCIQRWCEEKGSTVCEICLQKFEPGYSAPAKKALVDVPVTIRGSLEVQRLNYEARPEDEEDYYFNHAGWPAAAADRSFSYCRTIALMITVLLLYKHLLLVLSAGDDHYALTLLTVFALRAVGIVLPFYLIMRMISAVQHWQWQQHLQEQQHINGIYDFAVHEPQHHIINIHS